MKESRILSDVSVLTVSAVAVKIIGLCFRIPLMNTLGAEGMGYFHTAVEVYALFCVLSTAGLPTAVSVVISYAGQYDSKYLNKQVFRVSMRVFLWIGAVGSLSIFIWLNLSAIIEKFICRTVHSCRVSHSITDMYVRRISRMVSRKT